MAALFILLAFYNTQKDIRNLRAFINWCRRNRYVNGEIQVKELKEDERPVKSLSTFLFLYSEVCITDMSA